MLRVKPTKVSLSSEDIREYENAKASWPTTKVNSKASASVGNLKFPEEGDSLKRKATNRRIGLDDSGMGGAPGSQSWF